MEIAPKVFFHLYAKRVFGGFSAMAYVWKDKPASSSVFEKMITSISSNTRCVRKKKTEKKIETVAYLMKPTDAELNAALEAKNVQLHLKNLDLEAENAKLHSNNQKSEARLTLVKQKYISYHSGSSSSENNSCFK
jgi:cell division protein FtsB